MNLLNKTELAKTLKVSLVSIDAWIRKGCPYVKKGDKGRNYKFSLKEVEVWRNKYLGKTKPLQDLSISESRAIREHFRALNEELDYKIKMGEFINADVTMQIWGRVVMACRSRLLALPSKVAPVVVHLKSIPEVKDQIEKLIHGALNELSRLDIDKYAKEMIDEDKNNAEDKTKKNKKRKGGGQ